MNKNYFLGTILVVVIGFYFGLPARSADKLKCDDVGFVHCWEEGDAYSCTLKHCAKNDLFCNTCTVDAVCKNCGEQARIEPASVF